MMLQCFLTLSSVKNYRKLLSNAYIETDSHLEESKLADKSVSYIESTN